MAYSLTIPEAQLINEVARDWFGAYDCTKMIGDIDFCVSDKATTLAPQLWEAPDFMWAEAKAGNRHDIYESFVQLLLTIGKARTFEKVLPPSYLGAFDAEKIAFLPYHSIMAVFAQNDFNWNVAPSDHDTKEFRQLYDQVAATIDAASLLFSFNDIERLRAFIKDNFKFGITDPVKIEITRNNFVSVYFRWAETVKPTITVNWEEAKKAGIIDGDFYLADLLSKDNVTQPKKLYVLLNSSQYDFDRVINTFMGTVSVTSAWFNDGQKAHRDFWNIYKRPPAKEFWDYMVKHRDLLVPQDVRERKGSYFTPRQWVELSQKYLADTLGKNWQDEYYIWDCAAGTGNLLAGLTDKYKIWASTIDQADVDVMLDRIDHGANLLEGHVFKFDFLNDPFDKLPDGLRAIVEDPEKRKKLVIYINPPYAEHGNRRQVRNTGKNKTGVAINSEVYRRNHVQTGTAMRELFAQFLMRIYSEIPGCRIAQFSKLKAIQASNFKRFRHVFKAKLNRLFLIPAYTFDNVSGKFPIGFFIWDTQSIRKKKKGILIDADVYDADGNQQDKKKIYDYDNLKPVIFWLRAFYDKGGVRVGYLRMAGTDIQNYNTVTVKNWLSDNELKERLFATITDANINVMALYNAIRHVIPATWLNDRDQYLYPADTWQADTQFQTDCLAWTLFSNNVSCAQAVNHWIPFTEAEVGAKEAFDSHFMTDYMAGKFGKKKGDGDYKLGETYSSAPSAPLEFSPAAKAVFDAGRELWRYYHAQPGANPNAALYDIKAHFQGRDAKGRMNAKSGDETYNGLMANLRAALKALAAQIEPKVYEHGFLKR